MRSVGTSGESDRRRWPRAASRGAPRPPAPEYPQTARRYGTPDPYPSRNNDPDCPFTGNRRRIPSRMPATIVASRSEIRATAASSGAHPQRDLSRERSEGGQVQERVHHGGGEQCAGAQHRVAEHDAQAGERQCVERVTDLRDVAGEQREHDSRGEEGNDAGTHAPILGVAPVAPGQGRGRGPDEDQHRQPIDKLLTECAQGQTERLVRPSDVRGVLAASRTATPRRSRRGTRATQGGWPGRDPAGGRRPSPRATGRAGSPVTPTRARGGRNRCQPRPCPHRERP